jgi:hypothetical protein
MNVIKVLLTVLTAGATLFLINWLTNWSSTTTWLLTGAVLVIGLLMSRETPAPTPATPRAPGAKQAPPAPSLGSQFVSLLMTLVGTVIIIFVMAVAARFGWAWVEGQNQDIIANTPSVRVVQPFLISHDR